MTALQIIEMTTCIRYPMAFKSGAAYDNFFFHKTGKKVNVTFIFCPSILSAFPHSVFCYLI